MAARWSIRKSMRPPLAGGVLWRARYGGFTLLEVLIALALATALLGLVSVALFARLGAGIFDETLRQTRSALTLVREDARRSGEPLRLIARTRDDGRVEIVGLELDAPVEDPFGAMVPAGPFGEIDTTRIAFEEDADARTTADDRAPGRVYLLLPAGYSIERLSAQERESALEAMDSESGEGSPGSESGGSDSDRSDTEGIGIGGFGSVLSGPGGGAVEGPLTIGVFLPDGSVIAGEPPVLRSASGGLIEIVVNPWTGSVLLEPLRASERLDPLADDGDGVDKDGDGGDGGDDDGGSAGGGS